ncbi:MAG: type II toxin-antitoxin system HicB family antitoxin [Pseudomonadota bacterium]
MKHREPIGTPKRIYSCVFERNEDGRYTVTCPALPGMVTQGDTLEEARIMAREAIELYLESLEADGLPVPAGVELPERFTEAVVVTPQKA